MGITLSLLSEGETRKPQTPGKARLIAGRLLLTLSAIGGAGIIIAFSGAPFVVHFPDDDSAFQCLLAFCHHDIFRRISNGSPGANRPFSSTEIRINSALWPRG